LAKLKTPNVKLQASKLLELASNLVLMSESLKGEIETSKEIKFYEPIDNLGVIVRKVRKDQKVSLQVLAALSGISLGTIRAIEGGKKTASIENTVKILGALGKNLWIL